MARDSGEGLPDQRREIGKLGVHQDDAVSAHLSCHIPGHITGRLEEPDLALHVNHPDLDAFEIGPFLLERQHPRMKIDRHPKSHVIVSAVLFISGALVGQNCVATLRPIVPRAIHPGSATIDPRYFGIGETRLPRRPGGIRIRRDRSSSRS